MDAKTLVLHPDDDVAVALTDLPGIPAGHKIARRPLAGGTPVRKYGQVIGVTTAPVAAGGHVHGHNLAFAKPPAGRAVPARARIRARCRRPVRP